MDIHKLEKYVKILTDNYQLKLSEIRDYPQIEYSYNIINNSNFSNNEELINTILKEYRPSQLMPNTIGSFLFGCFQNTYGDIPAECSPLCAYSIKQDNSLRVNKCENQIFVQYNDDSNLRFVKLGNCESKQGYAFVYINFLGFTQEEKKYFESQGIYKLQLLVTKDSKHHTVMKMRDLHDLPTIEKDEDGIDYATRLSLDQEEQKDENTMIYIMISIVIIAMVVMYSQKNKL